MSATDKFMKTANATLTTLDAPGKPIGAISMNIISATNWPTDTGVIFAMRKIDASLVSSTNPSGTVANSYTEWAAQLSGTTLSNLTLVYGTDQDYSEGISTQVYIPLSGTWAQRLVDGILAEHKQSGAHKDVTADSLSLNGRAVGNFAPSGMIVSYAGSSPPTDWLLCDGSAVSRTTYSVLFGILGTTYGTGDGSTTFNLPNLKGKVPVGFDSGDAAFDALGETGGEKTHTLTVPEIPAHTHGITTEANAGLGADLIAQSNNAGLLNTNITTNSTGGGGAHNNLQPYITVNYIIKV